MLPTITVDNSICLGPLDCALCLQTCPMMVFIAGPTKKWKFRETDTKDYHLYARYYDQCVMCQKCVEVCPVEAITITAETGASDEPIEEELDEEPGAEFAEQPAPSD